MEKARFKTEITYPGAGTLRKLNLEKLTVRLGLTFIYFPIFRQARPDFFKVCLQLRNKFSPIRIIYLLKDTEKPAISHNRGSCVFLRKVVGCIYFKFA